MVEVKVKYRLGASVDTGRGYDSNLGRFQGSIVVKGKGKRNGWDQG